jgi:hypothetical protein
VGKAVRGLAKALRRAHCKSEASLWNNAVISTKLGDDIYKSSVQM